MSQPMSVGGRERVASDLSHQVRLSRGQVLAGFELAIFLAPLSLSRTSESERVPVLLISLFLQT